MVALASGLIAAILIAENAGIARSTRLHEAASADAVLQGAELSAIAALRRDMVQHPDSDDQTEAWARISDTDRKIAGGRFTLLVADAQAKLNLNALAKNDGPSLILLPAIVQALKLPPDTTIKMLALFKAVGPISSIAQLGLAGIDPATIAKLAALCTVLPPDMNRINVNDADEAMLSVLLGDPILGRLLANRRARLGLLTEGDFIAARSRVPAAAGFKSDFYWARGRVTIGGTTREQISLLRRDMADNQPRVVAISRWLGGAAPLDAPPLKPTS
nr:type II secretion system protein GspK [Sphingomonas vulcanisoli]